MGGTIYKTEFDEEYSQNELLASGWKLMDGGLIVPPDYDLEEDYAYKWAWSPESAVAEVAKVIDQWTLEGKWHYDQLVYIDTMGNEFGHWELRTTFGFKFRGYGLESTGGAPPGLLWKSDDIDNWRWTPTIENA